MTGADPGDAVAARRRLGRPPRRRRRARRRLRAARDPLPPRRRGPRPALRRTASACSPGRGRSPSSSGSACPRRSTSMRAALGRPERDYRLSHPCPGNRQRLGYTRIVQLLVYLVIVPTVLLLLVGHRAHVPGQRLQLRLRRPHGQLRARRGHGHRPRPRVPPARGEPQRAPGRLRLEGEPRASHAAHEHPPLRRDDGARPRRPGRRRQVPRRRSARETERLTRRIERLLDWGRMEAGRKLFDLREETVARRHRRRRPGVRAAPPPATRRSSSRRDVEPGLPAVLVDRAAMVDASATCSPTRVKYGGDAAGRDAPRARRARRASPSR